MVAKAARSSNVSRSAVMTKKGVVCSSSPLAGAIGAQVLREGGNAADAAIAVAAAEAVTLPPMCGMGGEVFALFYEAKTGEIHGVSGGGRAPMGATREYFVERGYDKMPTDGPLVISGYFRLLDGEPIDTLVLLMAVDAFPPVILKSDLPLAWVPTIELTAHVRARPAPGWLRCAFTTRFITGGFLEEDGEAGDSAGRLVAQSRQLALLPRG